MASSIDFFKNVQKQAHDIVSAGLAKKNEKDRLFFNAGPLTFDFNRQVINEKLTATFVEEAEKNNLKKRIEDLFSGELINHTEKRAALHWLLRAEKAPAGLEDEFSQVQDTLKLMSEFSNSVINGEYRPSGKAITHVVNLGVGGSDLGPRLAYDALKQYHNNVEARFVANVDGSDLLDALNGLNPETTLFIATSKTFTTLETLENTKAAQEWLKKSNIQNPGAHFAAATSKPAAAEGFGMDPSRIFPMWDWVGGRYSLLSSVGLALMIGIGPDAFNAIRKGAFEIDEHFKSADFAKNAPFISAALGVISVNGLDVRNHSVIAYDSRLNLLPNYLQQLEMESNGKSVNRDGQALDINTCPVLWGGIGTNTQHSFHQLLHQGTITANIDFFMPIGQTHGLADHQAYLQANCLAQAEALLHGKSLAKVKEELTAQGLSEAEIEALAPHKVIPGNKPCTIIGYKTLTAEVLGAIVALYEHRVLVQSHFWDINPFDQWGVELGKQLCQPVYDSIVDESKTSADSFTQEWVNIIREERKSS